MSRSNDAFREGAALFNEGRFFEAHEAWEKDWRKIPEPDRQQTQAMILVCGVFVLIEKGRLDPAKRLALLALERFAEASAQSKLLGLRTMLEAPEVEERLTRILAAFGVGESDPGHYSQYIVGLRVRVNLSEGE